MTVKVVVGPETALGPRIPAAADGRKVALGPGWAMQAAGVGPPGRCIPTVNCLVDPQDSPGSTPQDKCEQINRHSQLKSAYTI